MRNVAGSIPAVSTPLEFYTGDIGLSLFEKSLILVNSNGVHMISIDDFKKLEIRIGRVLSAEKLSNSDKLVRIIFDMGTEQRQVLAGIAEVFPDPSVLIGREMPVLVNLEARTMRGDVSNGMILAADNSGSPVLLHPAQEVSPGSIVR